MNLNYVERKFRTIAERNNQLYRRNRVMDCFVVKTHDNRMAFIQVERGGFIEGWCLSDQSRETARYVGKESYLSKHEVFVYPGGCQVYFHEKEADAVFKWFLDTIGTDKAPPVGLFDRKERVRGLPHHLYTSRAVRQRENMLYEMNKGRI